MNQPPNIHMNLAFKDGWGVEVQLTLTDFLKAKCKLHKAYEANRAEKVTEVLGPIYNLMDPETRQNQHGRLAHAPARPSQPSPQEFYPGAKVKIHGLQNAAHLNGQSAILESFIDSSHRWRVQLEDGEKKDLKPQNLKL